MTTLTRAQESLWELLRERQGKRVATEEILGVTGWKKTRWEVLLRNDLYIDLLARNADDQFTVIMPVGMTVEDFKQAITRKRSASEYRPYDLGVIEAIEQLTNDRARPPATETPLQVQVRQEQIQRLAGRLKNYSPPRPGSKVAGARLSHIIGKGTFGVVWHASDVETGQPVAVKIFDSDRLGLGRTLHHFRRGVRAMEHLNASGDRPTSVVKLIRAESTKLAFAMELVDNKDLEELPVAQRRWSSETKARVFRVICEAVRFAHEHEVIHRDIKPSNIVMRSDDRPVLTDFDIADLLFARTRTAAHVGDVAYAAPEELDRRAVRGAPTGDVYSLGRLLYYLLCESHPSVRNEVSTADLPVGTPEYLADIVYKATMFDPALRYQTVTELLEDLTESRSNGRGRVLRIEHAQSMFAQADAHAAEGHWKAANRDIGEAIKLLPASEAALLEKWENKRLDWMARDGDKDAASRIVAKRKYRYGVWPYVLAAGAVAALGGLLAKSDSIVALLSGSSSIDQPGDAGQGSLMNGNSAVRASDAGRTRDASSGHDIAVAALSVDAGMPVTTTLWWKACDGKTIRAPNVRRHDVGRAWCTASLGAPGRASNVVVTGPRVIWDLTATDAHPLMRCECAAPSRLYVPMTLAERVADLENEKEAFAEQAAAAERLLVACEPYTRTHVSLADDYNRLQSSINITRATVRRRVSNAGEPPPSDRIGSLRSGIVENTQDIFRAQAQLFASCAEVAPRTAMIPVPVNARLSTAPPSGAAISTDTTVGPPP